ncbi:thioredoxin domain-containing protein [Curtobacterium sp. RRHDQ10]|uniref:thioredoxin domain-containing protein n=1 Tax=Curtobacterium phyllosphaerae TaxID=3413379 RepID=UPI003BF186FC
MPESQPTDARPQHGDDGHPTDNRLGDAVSPYLRMHADNPVDWREWGPDAFAEAERRDVPVFVSIGYATCHWCHVMARESFADPEVAAILRDGFVSVKVDREERPDVDASAMMGASAFTENLGWPLSVYMTPAGRVFYAGTYSPPQPVGDHPSFRQVLAAVRDAWTDRREEVDANADGIAAAITAQGSTAETRAIPRPDDVHTVVERLAEAEDREHGGFGGAPKFPNAPLLEFLVEAGADVPASGATGLAGRTLRTIARSELRDPVDGGVFRYATRRDWTVPHFERMLYDNAGLLAVAGRLATSHPQASASSSVATDGSDGSDGSDGDGDGDLAAEVASGIAGFLRDTLRTDDGVFVAAQDSESTIDGRRVEGAWYRLRAEDRARLDPPPLDDQVLTGWNGLTIRGLAIAGAALGDDVMLADAARAADRLLETVVVDDRVTVRSSTPRGPSTAAPTVEDVGLLTEGLLELALATGEVRYATAARRIVDGVLDADGTVVLVGSADPVLAAAGTDPGEQPQTAMRSGTVALASALSMLAELTGSSASLTSAEHLVGPRIADGLAQPLGHADALALGLAFGAPAREIVLVLGDPSASENDGLVARVRRERRPGTLVAVVTTEQCRAWADAGFELFVDRAPTDRDEQGPVVYVCHEMVCDLPVRTLAALEATLST